MDTYQIYMGSEMARRRCITKITEKLPTKPGGQYNIITTY